MKIKILKLLIISLIITTTCKSQSIIEANDSLNIESNVVSIKYNIYVSIGSQIGILSHMGYSTVPFHIHIDKIVFDNMFIGFGYSMDDYKDSEYFLFSGGNYRQNFRIRYCSYFGYNIESPVIGYGGVSVGASSWAIKSNEFRINPSAQLLLGIKTNISNRAYNQTELGLGSPYLFQTSIGYKF